MSSSQIATALRPFYFFVHPDLFGKYPSERVSSFWHRFENFFWHQNLWQCLKFSQAVNESSLQSLSSFIETVKSEKPQMATTLTFYLKPQPSESNYFNLFIPSLSWTVFNSVCIVFVVRLKYVRIRLNENDVQKTVSSILSSCNLPTTYVDNLTKSEKYPGPGFKRKMNYSFEDNNEDVMKNMEYAIRQTLDNQLLW